jgi:tetratricopeptide (TPR) repeat protein
MNRALRRQQNKKGRKGGKGARAGAAGPLTDALRALQAGDPAGAFERALAIYGKRPDRQAAELAMHAAINMAEIADGVAAAARLAEAAADDAGIQNDYGALLCRANRFADAERVFLAALGLLPDDGMTLFNLGQALAGQDRFQDAEVAFRKAISAMPDNPQAHATLGAALDSQDRWLDALACYRKAHDLEPAQRRFRDQLEASLKTCGIGYDERERMYLADLVNDPGDFAAAMQLACVYRDTERLGQGVAVIEKWLPKEMNLAQEDRAQLREILSELQFLGGDFKSAWPNYHWRLRRRRRWGGEPVQPEWRGENLQGKSILVYAEQGIGDQVMFMAMLRDLCATGARVLLECDPRLVPLFRRSFPGVESVPVENPPVPETLDPGIDYHVAMGSLGCWLWDDFTGRSRGPYLTPDPVQVAALRRRYKEESDDRLLGLVWKSPRGVDAGIKSFALDELDPVLTMGETRIVDLQYGETAAERADMEARLGFGMVHDPSIDQMTDLDAFAAQIAAMDVVLAVSGSAAHMAGALGVPTVVLLSPAPQWKWGGEGERTDWYPSVTLLRRSVGKSREDQARQARNLIAQL